MENNINWKLERIADGKVRITVDSLSKLPSIEEYKDYIKNLLKIGAKTENIDKLKDESYSPDIGESLLLYQELKNLNKSSEYQEVVFSTPDGDITVNKENFNQVFESLANNEKIEPKKSNKNAEAIEHAVQELFERG